jgi:hypothetical protein
VFLEGGQPRGVGGGWRLLEGILVDCILSKEMKLSRRFRLRRFRKREIRLSVSESYQSHSQIVRPTQTRPRPRDRS